MIKPELLKFIGINNNEAYFRYEHGLMAPDKKDDEKRIEDKLTIRLTRDSLKRRIRIREDHNLNTSVEKKVLKKMGHG